MVLKYCFIIWLSEAVVVNKHILVYILLRVHEVVGSILSIGNRLNLKSVIWSFAEAPFKLVMAFSDLDNSVYISRIMLNLR